MAKLLGEDLREQLQHSSFVLPVYWVQKSQRNMVEKSLNHMVAFLDFGFSVDLLVHELTSHREEERGPW